MKMSDDERTKDVGELKQFDLVLPQMTARCMVHPGVSHGTLSFRFVDCVAYVSIGDKEIGQVSGLVGGGTELQHNDVPGTHWVITPQEFWRAFTEALVHSGLIKEDAQDEKGDGLGVHRQRPEA